jgi:hypothetical protein
MRSAMSIMGFAFTQQSSVCQDNSGAIAWCKSDRHHSRIRHFRMHVHLLKDCLNKRMRGDLFNKSHSPTRHMELCDMNGQSMYNAGTTYPSVVQSRYNQHTLVQYTHSQLGCGACKVQ